MVMLNAASEQSVMFMVHTDTHAHSTKDSNALEDHRSLSTRTGANKWLVRLLRTLLPNLNVRLSVH